MPNCFSVRFTSFVEKLLSKKNIDWPTAKEALAIIPSFVKQQYQEKFNPEMKDKEGCLNPKDEFKEEEDPIFTKPREDLLF